MLGNISLATLAQCIKYELLYDYHPTFPIKYGNIPIFPHRKKKTFEEEKKEYIDSDNFF
jgi:hypothetical protein